MTHNTNHTPGPWHLGVRPGPMVYGSKGQQIADLLADLLPPGENQANARLIAAAPDMLQILQRILRAHESGNNGAFMGEAVLCDAFAMEARAAIAKATGNP